MIVGLRIVSAQTPDPLLVNRFRVFFLPRDQLLTDFFPDSLFQLPILFSLLFLSVFSVFDLYQESPALYFAPSLDSPR